MVFEEHDLVINSAARNDLPSSTGGPEAKILFSNGVEFLCDPETDLTPR